MPIKIKIQPGANLFIDRLSFTLTPAKGDEWGIHQKLDAQLKNSATFQMAKAVPGWKVTRSIALSGTHHRVHFQYRYDALSAQKVRVDFNPRKIGAKGLESLKGIFKDTFPGGWGYFVEHARITRIDIAADMPNANIDEFRFLPLHPVTVQFWRVDGHLRSVIHGKAGNKQTLVYEVHSKRKSKKQAWTGPATVRVERRLYNPKVTLANLATLPNPFSALTLVPNFPPPPPGSGPKQIWLWDAFADSVQVRGLEAAMMFVPDDRRAVYRKYLRSKPHSKWKPFSIWLLWKGVVEGSGLGIP